VFIIIFSFLVCYRYPQSDGSRTAEVLLNSSDTVDIESATNVDVIVDFGSTEGSFNGDVGIGTGIGEKGKKRNPFNNSRISLYQFNIM